MARFQERIKQNEASLTGSEKKIITQLKKHEKPFLLSMNELALLSKVSEPSVVRLYKKLGYSSYQELKVALAQELAETKPALKESADIEAEDLADTVFGKMSEQITAALTMTKHAIEFEKMEEAIDKLHAAERLYFFGQGLSGTIAEDGAHKFMRLGGMALSVKDPHYQAIYASHMDGGDVVVAISHSGETIDIINVCDMAKSNGACLIVITSNKNTTLASMADYLLLTQAAETNRQPDAMVSRVIQLALIDTLYLRVAAMVGPTGKENVNKSRLAVTRMKK